MADRKVAVAYVGEGGKLGPRTHDSADSYVVDGDGNLQLFDGPEEIATYARGFWATAMIVK